VTNRVSSAPQEVEKMCRQAERDHESRKLLVLLERVKQQIAVRQSPTWSVDSHKPPVTVISSRSSSLRASSRTAPFDR
jgi:hypothetical protein